MKQKLVVFTVLTLFVTAAFAAESTTTAPTTAQRYGKWGFDTEGMDRSVKPGDDFFKYVNGHWAATTQIPADKTGYGSFPILSDLSEVRVRRLQADTDVPSRQADRIAAFVAERLLEGVTLYRFKPEDLRTAQGLGVKPAAVTVTSRGVEVTLASTR